MIRLWPRSLAGQMIALLLLALVAAQAISVLIFFDERRQAVVAAERGQVVSRTVSIVRLLIDSPPDLSARIVETASGPRLGYWLADAGAVEGNDPRQRDNPLRTRLATLLDGTGVRDVLVDVSGFEPGGFGFWRRDRPSWWWQRHHDAMREPPPPRPDDERGDEDVRRPWHDSAHWRTDYRRRPLSLTIAILLPDGRWLNAATLLPPVGTDWIWVTLASLGATALAIMLIVAFSLGRITRPMRALADAAERLGRGEDVTSLPDAGPIEVRRTTHAFNEMRERLQRFVRDRTRMLAAISHDLRTPITTLRLRAEFIEDQEVRDKILETLAEMQEMTEAVLAFIREDAAREDTRRIDLAALAESLCADLAETGLDVAFADAPPTPYSCRPVALKRALGNLVENAVAYGARARVALADRGKHLELTVDDDGPGIPEADLERVFEPFTRLEDSRSRETGGVGLGLAIARSIARGHGGDVVLSNRAGGGLRATLRLPKAGAG